MLKPVNEQAIMLVIKYFALLINYSISFLLILTYALTTIRNNFKEFLH